MILSQPGTSEQLIDNRDEPEVPDGYVEMDQERPSPNHICQDNGDGTGGWILDLDGIKSRAVIEVDHQAEQARQQRVTPGNYQPAEYERARQQAEAYVAGEITDSAALQADVDAGTIDPRTGSPVADQAEAADLVLYMRDQWFAALDQIRTERLAAKRDIEQAADEAGVQAVLDGLAWPNTS